MAYSAPQKNFIDSLTDDSVVQIALFVAVLAHALLLFGLSFVSGTTPAAMMQEVVDVISQDPSKKKQADFIASSSQQGSGTDTVRLKMESPDRSPANAKDMNITLDTENTQKKQTAQQYMQRYLNTTLSIEKVNKDTKKKDNDKKTNKSKESEDRVLAQIATLEAQFARRQQQLAKKTKVKTVTSAMDTKASADAAYVMKFKKRVEQIGNAHYPEVARSENLTGDVRLMVIVSKQGNVKAIRLLQSSGSRLLDKYAKATVRQSAPFGEFTKDMDTHELRIIRTWRFANTITVDE